MANHTQPLLSLATPLLHKKENYHTMFTYKLITSTLYVSCNLHVNKHLNHTTITPASNLTT